MYLLFKPEHQAAQGLQFHIERLLNINDYTDIVGMHLYVAHPVAMNKMYVALKLVDKWKKFKLS